MNATFIDIDSDAHLRPVLELGPGDFGSCPDLGPGPWTTQQSDLYWRTCLAGSGIVDLEPVLPGRWLVSARDIAAPFPLNKILEAHFEGAEIPVDLDEFSPLAGGFALCHGTQPFFLPTCCGDLANLAEWKKAATQRRDSPEMLWIGHPWLSTWFADGRLHIREEQENGNPESPRTVRLRPEILETAIADADRELDHFLAKILTVLGAMPGPIPAHDIGRHLIGRRGIA